MARIGKIALSGLLLALSWYFFFTEKEMKEMLRSVFRFRYNLHLLDMVCLLAAIRFGHPLLLPNMLGTGLD